MASSSPSLRVSGLACRRGDRLLFEDVSFDLASGEALALAGPNGAGKTSLLRILAGLLEAEAGEVTLAGDAICLGHLDALKPQMTVAENLAFWVALFGGETGGIGACLDRFGIARLADLPAGILSAGQRRRLGLARLARFIGAASPRPIWLMDEPDAALDMQGRAALEALMAEHLAAGGVAVAATHHGLAAATRRLDLVP